MKRFIERVVVLITFLSINGAYGQTVKGVLRDETDDIPLSGATVKLIALKDSSLNAVTDKKGSFIIQRASAGKYTLSITSIGYATLRMPITVAKGGLDLGNIPMGKSSKVLSAVTIVASAPPVKQKQDTLEYSANSFKTNPDATAEDLIKKMPGITVDKAGTVTAHGDQVKKVTVDGKEFFGDDATAALRNLPSEVIDKIQVFDKLSDQAAFTGFDDGSSVKAINIVTKSNMKNGQFGRVYAGYGTDQCYAAGGHVSFFNGNRRISLVGLLNNVNQQNFSSQDLLGVTSSGGRGGRGGGGNRGGGAGGFQGGNGSNFLVGAQSGISKTNAFGINYSNQLGKKLTVTGSYFFNNSSTPNTQILTQQYLNNNSDSVRYYKENNTSTNNNYNNRINLRLEYKLDSANSLIITPNLSFQNNTSGSMVKGINSFGTNRIISKTDNTVNTSSSGYNINNGILLRHMFHKRGRTISVGMNNSLSNRKGNTYLQAYNKYYKGASNYSDSLNQLSDNKTEGNQTSFNLAYTEPIGKKSQLQVNYNPSFTNNKADQETSRFDYTNTKYALLDTALSNKFTNHFNTHNTGLAYRYGDKDNQFSAGLYYQYATLNSDEQFPFITTIHKTYSNILPNLMARIKLSAKSSIRLFYRTSTNPPSINQLQNVINNTNPFFLTIGNPNLQQQYTNNLVARYTYTNSLKGSSFFANFFLQSTNDYVANATFTARRDSVLSKNDTLFRGSQISKPVNLNGYISARSFLTYGFPLKFIRSTINMNVGLSYANLPGMIDNVSNLSKTYSYNVGAVLASNISQYIDFNLSYSANISKVTNSIQPKLNSNYYTQSAGVQVNLLLKTGWFLQNDVSNQSYTGLTNGFNQHYTLWNAALGKKFLKDQNGELKLSVFDLLKQNKSITRNTTETYIEDVQNQVLQQYFMLTFTYKLKNFGKGKPMQMPRRDFREGGPDRGGFGF
ncbi:MAG: TonB-dependent receptor [Ginsengibacter sp.]